MKDIIEKDNYSSLKSFRYDYLFAFVRYVLQSYFILLGSQFLAKSLKLSTEDLSSFSNYDQLRFNVSA